MTIGERIKKRRIDLGMSQDELARKMGYQTRNAIYQFEQKDNMKLSIVEKFATVLETTPAWLMGWEDDNGNILGETSFTPKNDLTFEQLSDAINLYNVYTKASPDVRRSVDLLLQAAQQINQSVQSSLDTGKIPQLEVEKPRASIPHLKKDKK